MDKFNIKIKKPNLFKYNIHDYYNEKNDDNFLPYLWTSAFGLLRLLKIFKSNLKIKTTKSEIEKYIFKVHSILAIHSKKKLPLSDLIIDNLSWFSNLQVKDRELIDSLCSTDNLKGSIRIGKFEQQEEGIGEEPGIYLHYCTKWAYGLIKTSQLLEDNMYLYQSANMMLTMCEKNINKDNNEYPRKMKEDLSEPEQTNEIAHDPLDVFIILMNLIYCFIKQEKNEEVKNLYLELLIDKLIINIPRIEELNNSPEKLENSDLLGVGFLFVSCYKIRILLNKFRSKIFKNNKLLDKLYRKYSYQDILELLKLLYLNLLNQSDICNDKHIDFTEDIVHENAYRWFGISIGFQAIKNLQKLSSTILNKNYKTNSLDFKTQKTIEKIMKIYHIRNNIHQNFNTYSYRKSNWNDHIDINIVTYLYSKNPFFLF